MMCDWVYSFPSVVVVGSSGNSDVVVGLGHTCPRSILTIRTCSSRADCFVFGGC